jgi:integrase
MNRAVCDCIWTRCARWHSRRVMGPTPSCSRPRGSAADGCHAPFVGLLDRLMRHTMRIAGVRMNPHLYRHFVGWLWLKEDPNRLPDVQRLLGHKSLETTLRYYAEIDENLALDRWQQFLADRKSGQPKALMKKGK